MSVSARKKARKRREDLVQSFPDERRAKVLRIRELIRKGEYDIEGKFEAIFDDLLEDLTKG
ncbi:MAG: hypothetical protein HY719_01650 [Planctomycetes bacterium]|nr:hypothetical protein [Planctomycetota bacterium]